MLSKKGNIPMFFWPPLLTKDKKWVFQLSDFILAHITELWRTFDNILTDYTLIADILTFCIFGVRKKAFTHIKALK